MNPLLYTENTLFHQTTTKYLDQQLGLESVYTYNNEDFGQGGLPAGMREEDMGVKSVPRNPLLFGMFYRMGMVEQVGSGIKRIREMCRDYGVAEPVIEVSENWVTTTFKRPSEEVAGEVTPQVRKVVSVLQGEQSRGELIDSLSLKDRMHFMNEYLQPSLDAGWIEMTIPDKPRNRNQKYRLTARGKALLTEVGGAQE